MKSLLIVCLFVMVAVAMVSPQKYTNKYDNMDIEEVISNHRLLVSYIKCLLDEGPCTAEGKELKAHIQEALENGCAMCTEAQNKGLRRIILHLINNEPEYWEKLRAKYDPENIYLEKYDQDLEKLKAQS